MTEEWLFHPLHSTQITTIVINLLNITLYSGGRKAIQNHWKKRESWIKNKIQSINENYSKSTWKNDDVISNTNHHHHHHRKRFSRDSPYNNEYNDYNEWMTKNWKLKNLDTEFKLDSKFTRMNEWFISFCLYFCSNKDISRITKALNCCINKRFFFFLDEMKIKNQTATTTTTKFHKSFKQTKC